MATQTKTVEGKKYVYIWNQINDIVLGNYPPNGPKVTLSDGAVLFIPGACFFQAYQLATESNVKVDMPFITKDYYTFVKLRTDRLRCIIEWDDVNNTLYIQETDIDMTVTHITDFDGLRVGSKP